MDRLLIRWHRERISPGSASGTGQVECLIRSGTPLDCEPLARLIELPPGLQIEEILVAAYERFGNDLPALFTVSCSFVLWDGIRERLFASADPNGHYPIFFFETASEVAVSSRAELLVSPGVARLNLESIASHLCGFAPRSGTTFFLGVRSLPPGGTLVIDRRKVTIRALRDRSPRKDRPPNEVIAAEKLRSTLFETAPDYAPEGRPIGITLSSGLDSTTLAAALRVCRPNTRRVAFIWTSRSLPEADESAPATRVARSLGMEVVEIAADIAGPLTAPRGIEPSLGNPSCNIYSEVWRETFRRAQDLGIEILWTGQGGDAGFGAVFPFADLFLSGRWLRLVREVRAYRRRLDVDLPWLIRYRILGRSARWLIPLRRPFPPPWLGPSLRKLVPEFSTADRFALPGDRERRRFLDNPRRFTATAMMTAEAAEFGVDLRNPWLDPRLIDLARSLPAFWTFADGVAKAPVRRAMQGLLPEEILNRSDKIYPEALFVRALQGSNRAKIEPLLREMRSADLGFVEAKALREGIDLYAQGKRRGSLFWHSLTLEAWLRRLSG